MNVFEIFGTIGLKDEASKGLDETVGRAKQAGNEMEGTFRKAAVVIGAIFATDKLIDFGKMAVNAASELKAMEAQFDQVFGDLVAKGQSKIEELGDKFGILPNRIKPYFTSMTSKFKGLGMDTESAMKQAETATNIAADAAAFYDKTLEDASGSLNSFVNGSYEGGEAIGLFANETQMAQFAIQEGIVKSTAEWQKLDEATKQATRLEYAQRMYDLSGATGQAARESEGWANVTANLSRAWQDFLGQVGAPILEALIPVVVTITNVIAGMPKAIENTINSYKEWRNQNMLIATAIEGIALSIAVVTTAIGIYKGVMALASIATTAWATVTGALNAVLMTTSWTMGMTIGIIGLLIAIVYVLWQNWSTIGPMLIQLWTNISTWVSQSIQGILTWLSNLWTQGVQYVSNMATGVKQWFTDMWTTAKQKATDIYNSVSEWFGKIPGRVKTLWGQVMSYLKGINLYDIGVNIVQGLWNGIKSLWGRMVGWFESKVSGLINTARKALSIFSPSRDFRDMIGAMIPKGIQVGVEDEFPKLEDSLTENLQGLTDIKPIMDAQLGLTAGNAPAQDMTQYMVVDALDMIIQLLEKLGMQEFASYLDGHKVSRDLDDPLRQYQEKIDITDKRMKGAY